MESFIKITTILTFLSVLNVTFSQNQGQNQTVTYCPLYLVLQNRCPTPSTTTTSIPGNNATDSDSDVTDECDLSSFVITFCPQMLAFIAGQQNCREGPTIHVRLTTLGQLLVDPSAENAAAAVGASYVDELGDTFSSISKTIQATPTQSTVGVTFVPVGQIVG